MLRKAFKITNSENLDLNGIWKVKKSKQGVVIITYPENISKTIQVGPGCNGGQFNKRFNDLPSIDQEIIIGIIEKLNDEIDELPTPPTFRIIF